MSSSGWLRDRPKALLVVLAVLALAFVGSAVLLITVAAPPSYEPVPVPSVTRT
ncbi:MAG: hypothetical protein QM650_04465 [Microlunatus sp.]